METVTRSNVDAIAYHEAAHCIIAMIYKIPFNSVTIIPSEGTLGKVNAHGHFDQGLIKQLGIESFNTSEEKLLRQHAAILLSGALAEQKYLGQELPEEYWDYQSDWEKIGHFAFKFGGSEELAGKFIDDVFEEVTLQLENSSIWNNIEVVAQALVIEKTLSYQQVSKLVSF